MFIIEWHDSALRELDKLDNFLAKIIIKKIDKLKENHFSKDVIRLMGREEYRLRVGDYRVIFEVIGNEVLFIKKIGHRKNIYE